MEGKHQDQRLRPAMVVGSLLATSALAVGMIIFGAVACSTSDLKSGLDSPVPSSPEALLAELKQDKERIDSITDGMADRVKAFNTGRDPGEPTLNLSDVFYDDLAGSERDVLTTMLDTEEDVSYKALLSALARDRETIRALQNRVLRMEQSLPDQFVVAGKGDSQYDLAMSYLTGEAGLDRPASERVLSRIDMSDELIPGNRVWLFYERGSESFRTYVTQGEAGQMPVALRRALKRKLVTERDAARAHAEALSMDLDMARLTKEAEVATLTEKIEALRDRHASLETEVSDLNTEQDFLEDRVAELSSALADRENSLFFHAAAESELKDRGVITRVFKRFQDVKDVDYDRALNLTRGTTINLHASEFGLEKIGRIKVLPDVFHSERDYVVERSEDGATATVTILEPEMFRGKEVVLSVKG